MHAGILHLTRLPLGVCPMHSLTRLGLLADLLIMIDMLAELGFPCRARKPAVQLDEAYWYCGTKRTNARASLQFLRQTMSDFSGQTQSPRHDNRSDSGGAGNRLARLGHRKSRNGCQRCRARRVKVRSEFFSFCQFLSRFPCTIKVPVNLVLSVEKRK